MTYRQVLGVVAVFVIGVCSWGQNATSEAIDFPKQFAQPAPAWDLSSEFRVQLPLPKADGDFYYELPHESRVTIALGPNRLESLPSGQDASLSGSLLGSFSGASPSKTWKLFLADLDSGQEDAGKHFRTSIATVPEPSSFALIGLGALLVYFTRRSRRGCPIP